MTTASTSGEATRASGSACSGRTEAIRERGGTPRVGVGDAGQHHPGRAAGQPLGVVGAHEPDSDDPDAQGGEGHGQRSFAEVGVR